MRFSINLSILEEKMEIDCIGLFVNNMGTMVKFYRDITNWNGDPNADFEAGKCRLIMFGRMKNVNNEEGRRNYRNYQNKQHRNHHIYKFKKQDNNFK
jgi:hypothetical protein